MGSHPVERAREVATAAPALVSPEVSHSITKRSTGVGWFVMRLKLLGALALATVIALFVERRTRPELIDEYAE